MMTRVLALLLLLQLGLVAALYWPGEDGPGPRSALLQSVDRNSVTAISILTGEGDSIALARRGDDWQLPSGLPADAAKVATLLDALLGSDPGFAIASSDSAAARFEVADEAFERRIELSAGDDTRTVFLGSSPAFRKVHARIDGDNAVYVLAFNSYDAPATAIGWLDRGLFAMRNLENITLDGNAFELAGDAWLNSAGEPVDAGAMESLLTALAGLQVSGINAADNETAAAAQEVLRVEGTAADGSRQAVTLLENSESELYYLRGESFGGLFNTSGYDAERLLDAVATLTGVADSVTADADAAPAAVEEDEAAPAAAEESPPGSEDALKAAGDDLPG